MSCKYCDIKMRSLDEDTKVLKGESWKDGLGDEGGYIGPSHDDKFRMMVNYDAGFACTEVSDVKYCPFCGEELKLPAEPLIKDEKIRKAVRAWAKANNIQVASFYASPHHWYLRAFNDGEQGIDFWLRWEDNPELIENKRYNIDDLCGEEEE